MTSFLINPYRFGGAWTPANITTALWLDAADATTITTVSGAVSQWNDKSGNGRNATQGTVANRPAYAANTVSFDGVNDFLSLSQPYGSTSQASLSCFAVASSNETSVLIGTADLTVMGWRNAFQIRAANGTTVAYTHNFNDSNYHVSSLILDGSAVKSWGDSTASTNITASTGLWNFGGSQFIARGDGSLGTTVYQLNLREIVITSSAVSELNRQRIEGYLAHKWGLAGSLPAGHPYKSAPPTA